jgi:hypothetical protein
VKSCDLVKETEADHLRKLDRYLRRFRRLIDEGKLDDPSIIRAVQSLEERLEAGLLHERTEAEVVRLTLLSRDFRLEAVR